jgi:hypothetical protein
LGERGCGWARTLALLAPLLCSLPWTARQRHQEGRARRPRWRLRERRASFFSFHQPKRTRLARGGKLRVGGGPRWTLFWPQTRDLSRPTTPPHRVVAFGWREGRLWPPPRPFCLHTHPPPTLSHHPSLISDTGSPSPPACGPPRPPPRTPRPGWTGWRPGWRPWRARPRGCAGIEWMKRRWDGESTLAPRAQAAYFFCAPLLILTSTHPSAEPAPQIEHPYFS